MAVRLRAPQRDVAWRPQLAARRASRADAWRSRAGAAGDGDRRHPARRLQARDPLRVTKIGDAAAGLSGREPEEARTRRVRSADTEVERAEHLGDEARAAQERLVPAAREVNIDDGKASRAQLAEPVRQGLDLF